jgi:hypothetical protein
VIRLQQQHRIHCRKQQRIVGLAQYQFDVAQVLFQDSRLNVTNGLGIDDGLAKRFQDAEPVLAPSHCSQQNPSPQRKDPELGSLSLSHATGSPHCSVQRFNQLRDACDSAKRAIQGRFYTSIFGLDCLDNRSGNEVSRPH